MKTLSWEWRSSPDPETITKASQAMEDLVVPNKKDIAWLEIFGTDAEFSDGVLSFDAVEFSDRNGVAGQTFTWPGWLPGEITDDNALSDGKNVLNAQDQPYGEIALQCLLIAKDFFGDELEIMVDGQSILEKA